MTAEELYRAVIDSPPFDDPRLVPVSYPSHRDSRFFARITRLLQPSLIVELGTGTGRSAAQFAAAKPENSHLVTINWSNPPSGDNVGIELAPWHNDHLVTMILGDTREQAWRFLDCTVDLLYIDSTHTYECASEEWKLYSPKLADEAVVVVDDLNQNDMDRFWSELPYDKCYMFDGHIGMFLYKRNWMDQEWS